MAFNKAKSLKVAEKYVQQGKIAAAIEEYKKIVEADPNDLTMINTLGDLCVRAGRTEEAIFNFSKIAENYRQNGFTLKAIAMYKKISKLEPNNFDILLKLADLYAKQGLVVDAKQQYLQVAEAYKRGGQSRKAIDVLKKVADLDPADTATKLKLAESYQMEGMNAEAQEVFVAIGQELQRKSKFVEAIQALQRALSISSDSKVALKSLIDCYIQQGDTQQALSLINSALEKNPTDTDLLVLLGKTYLNAKMLAEAENAFTRLISVDNSRYDYLLEVGKKYLERGMFDKVLAISDKCVEQVLKRRTEEKVVSLLKGVLEYDSNNLKALKKLSDIYTRVREEHNLADTLKKIVDVALRTGDKDAAIDALKTLTEIEPDETAHRQRLANLGAIAAPQPSPPSTRSLPIGSKPEGIGPLIPTVAPIAAPVSPIIGTGTKPLPPPLSGDAEKKLQEARLFISRGYSAHAAGILENLLEDHPHYIEARVELKKIYEEGGEVKKAAGQALELARLYEARGDVALAQQMLQESRKLEAKSPAGAATLASGFGITGVSQAEAEESYEVEIDLSAPDTISDKSAIPVIEPEPFSSAGMNLFGGTPVSPTQPSPPVSDIFGGLPGSSSSPASGAGMNLFGGTPVSPTQPSPPVSDIFGGLPGSSSSPASGAGMNLFGGTPVSPTQPSPPVSDIFGGLPGSSSSPASGAGMNLFGGTPVSPTQPSPPVSDIFGGLPGSSSSPASGAGMNLFGGTPVSPTQPSPPVSDIFGGLPGSSSSPASGAGMNLFGGTPVSPTQPSPPVSDIFGGLPGSSSSPASGAGMNLFGGIPTSPTQPSPPVSDIFGGLPGSSSSPASGAGMNLFGGIPTSPTQPSPPLGMVVDGRQLGEPGSSQRGAGSAEMPHIGIKGAASTEVSSIEFEIRMDEDVSSKEGALSSALEEIDFYLRHGYAELGKERLDALCKEYPNHPEVMRLLAKLGIATVDAKVSQPESKGTMEVLQSPVEVPFDELINDTAFGETTLSEVRDILPQQQPAKKDSSDVGVGVTVSSGISVDKEEDDDLAALFDDFKQEIEVTQEVDFETHYNLGLAYKDMELYEEAIEEFQTACKATDPNSTDGRYFDCCNMLGFCFLQKGQARPAALWYKKGLESPARSEEQYQAMRYDLAIAYERLGEYDKALELLQEVYALDINYRNVAAKIKELKESKKLA